MNLLAISFNCDRGVTTGHYLAVKDHTVYLPLIYIIMCLLGTDYRVLQKRACSLEGRIGDNLRSPKTVCSSVETPFFLCVWICDC
jgi:hypothetical protein